MKLYLLEGNSEGSDGGHVLSSRDSRICLYWQILNLRFFPAICSLCSVQIFQFLFVGLSLSLSQSYVPHNTYTYVFLFFVSSHVCLIFPTQKTWLNFFSSARHSLLRSFHIFIVIQLGFFHVAAVVFGQMFAQLLADNKRKRATTTYKKGVYFVRPRSRVFQFSALQIEIQSEFAKQSRRNLTYAGHIISQDVCGCLAKSIQL